MNTIRNNINQNVSMKSAAQLKITQKYYDTLAKELENGAAFYNEKTGNTLLVLPADYVTTMVSLWKGKIEKPLFHGSMSDIVKSLGDAKQIFQIHKSGEVVYRRPESIMPFITDANKCTKAEYQELQKFNRMSSSHGGSRMGKCCL